MLKTDQGRKTGINGKVGKPVNQEAVVIRKHPQYLEVAIEKSRKDSESKTDRKVSDSNRNNVKQRKINYVPYERVGSKQVSETSTVGTNSQRNSRNSRNPKVIDNVSKYGKAGSQQKIQGSTFNKEKWFENKENQKLYEELDQMLEGANAIQKLGNKKPATEKKVDKRDKVKTEQSDDKPIRVVYSNKKPKARPLEPEVILQYKRLPPDRPTRLNKHGFFGPEGTKVWKECEDRAKEQLDKINNIDNFELGDYTSRSKKLEAERRAKFAEYAERSVPDVPQQVTTTFTDRNHIVADIPIFLPPGFDESNATIESVRGPVLHSVLPSGQIQSSADIPAHLTGLPVPLTTDQLDTYRHRANPVSERILLEQAEKERIQLEKETLEFFEGEQEDEPDRLPALGQNLESLRKSKKGKAYRSAPPAYENSRDKAGDKVPKSHIDRPHSAERRKTPELNDLTHRSRNTYPDTNVRDRNQRENSYGQFKYSPEGFQAHLERKSRLEKEAKILSKAETNKSKWDLEDEALAKQRLRRAQIDSRVEKDSNEKMDTYRVERKEERRDEDIDMTLKILNEKQKEFLNEHFGAPATFRVPKETFGEELSNSERGRYVDQDRYSDRNVNSYREKNAEQERQNEAAYRGNDKTDGRYSYRSLKDAESENQERKTNRKQSADKVEYVLRSKSSDSKQSTYKRGNVNNDIKRENTNEAVIKVRMDREISSGITHRSKKSTRRNKEELEDKLRQPSSENETKKAKAAEMKVSSRKEVAKAQRVEQDPDLNKYFLDPERPDSEANNIPLYSKSQYSKQNGEIQGSQGKDRKQESGYKVLTERDKKMVHVTLRPETVDAGVNTEPNRSDRQTSTDHLISPRKEKIKDGNDASYAQNKAVTAIDSEVASVSTAPIDTAMLTREKTREKTRDKLKRQKTVDSQGPTTGENLNIEDLEMAGVLNLDEIEEGLDENEVYVCYLVTDDGAAIGPLKLDIEDVQIGLPKGGVPNADKETNEENQEPEKGDNENEGNFCQKLLIPIWWHFQ